MTQTPEITGKSFIGFCLPCSSSGSAQCGAGATHGHVSSDPWRPWVPWVSGKCRVGGIQGWMGPPCPPASPGSSRRVQTPGASPGTAGDGDVLSHPGVPSFA